MDSDRQTPYTLASLLKLFPAKTNGNMKERGCWYQKAGRVVLFGLAMAYSVAASSASGQIHSTISCPSGHNYWDVLSVMMMDPSLAAGYHMAGLKNGLPSSYV